MEILVGPVELDAVVVGKADFSMSWIIVIERVGEAERIVRREFPVRSGERLDVAPAEGNAFDLCVGGVWIGDGVPKAGVARYEARLRAVLGHIAVIAILRVEHHVLIAIVLAI